VPALPPGARPAVVYVEEPSPKWRLLVLLSLAVLTGNALAAGTGVALHACHVTDAYGAHMLAAAALVAPAAYAGRRRVERALWWLHTGERAAYLAAAAALSVAALLYVEVVLLRGLGEGVSAPPPPPLSDDALAAMLAAATGAAATARAPQQQQPQLTLLPPRA
jgi:hypothetical protein